MRKKIVIGDEYRTNGLSLSPGGHTVTVVYANGTRRVYDKVKNVRAYANNVLSDTRVVKILCEDEVIWTR